MTFGEKLQALRRKEGLTQEGLASRIGVSRQALGKWEQGTAMPDAQNVLELARLFEVTTDYLLKDELEEPQAGPVAPEQPVPVKGKDSVLWPVFGGITSLLGAVGILVLKIFSSIHPAYISAVTTYDGEFIPARVGFSSYLEVHNLEWLYHLCLFLVVLGVLLAFFPKLRRRWSAWINRP